MNNKIAHIVAMTVGNHIIGSNGSIPWYLPADLKHFREMTLGKCVIMGRKTHESIGKLLLGRHNIVITKKRGFQARGAPVVYSVNAALDLAVSLEPEKEIMIIGGGEIYRQTMPIVDVIYATFVHGNFDGNVHYPQILAEEWVIDDYDFMQTDPQNPTPYSFVKYIRRNK